MLPRSGQGGWTAAPRAGAAAPAHRVLLADGQQHELSNWLCGGWPTTGGQGRAGGGGGRRNASRPTSAQRRAFAHPLGLAREWLASSQPATTAAHHLPAAHARAWWGQQSGRDPRRLVPTLPHPQRGLCLRQCQRGLWHARTAPRHVPPCPNEPTPLCIWEMAADSRAPPRRRYPVRASPDSVRGAEPRRKRQTPQPSTHSWGDSLCGEIQGSPPLQTAQAGGLSLSNRNERPPTTRQSLDWSL